MAVLSKNMLEATDLCEFFEHRVAGPVLVLGDPDQATPWLREGRLRPKLAIFGYALHEARSVACWQSLRRLHLPTILLDGAIGLRDQCGDIWSLSRPFTTADLETALARTGLPDRTHVLS